MKIHPLLILIFLFSSSIYALDYQTDRMNFPPGESRLHTQTITNDKSFARNTYLNQPNILYPNEQHPLEKQSDDRECNNCHNDNRDGTNENDRVNRCAIFGSCCRIADLYRKPS